MDVSKSRNTEVEVDFKIKHNFILSVDRLLIKMFKRNGIGVTFWGLVQKQEFSNLVLRKVYTDSLLRLLELHQFFKKIVVSTLQYSKIFKLYIIKFHVTYKLKVRLYKSISNNSNMKIIFLAVV